MRYCVVKENYVINIIIWDGVEPTIYDDDVDITLLAEPDGNVGVGYRYNTSQEIFYLVLNNIEADLPEELDDLFTDGAFYDFTADADIIADLFYVTKAGYVIDKIFWDGESVHTYTGDGTVTLIPFDYEGAYLGARWDSVNERFLLPMRKPSDMPSEIVSLPWDVYEP